jgi:hypothetical protein
MRARHADAVIVRGSGELADPLTPEMQKADRCSQQRSAHNEGMVNAPRQSETSAALSS